MHIETFKAAILEAVEDNLKFVESLTAVVRHYRDDHKVLFERLTSLVQTEGRRVTELRYLIPETDAAMKLINAHFSDRVESVGQTFMDDVTSLKLGQDPEVLKAIDAWLAACEEAGIPEVAQGFQYARSH